MKNTAGIVGPFRKAMGLSLLLGGLLFANACSTTTIQTGGSQGVDRDSYAERAADPEANFFQELSDQDDAYGDAQPETQGVVQTADADDCPCEATQPAVATTETEPVQENIVPASTNDNFFDADDAKPTETVADNSEFTPPASGDFNEVGTASWYGRDFDGKSTANGETFDSRKLTAAHKKIPLGSIVLVRNLENNREVLVTVNDRGPFVKGRVLDMSEYGAEMLGYKEQGLTTVGIRVVRLGKGKGKGEGATKKFFDADGQAAAMGSDEVDLNVDRIREDSNDNHYSLQVGAFSDLKNARSLERYLKHHGYPLEVVRRDGMFAVKMGNFDSRYEAEQVKSKLSAEGYSAFIASPPGR